MHSLKCNSQFTIPICTPAPRPFITMTMMQSPVHRTTRTLENFQREASTSSKHCTLRRVHVLPEEAFYLFHEMEISFPFLIVCSWLLVFWLQSSFPPLSFLYHVCVHYYFTYDPVPKVVSDQQFACTDFKNCESKKLIEANLTRHIKNCL